MILQCDVRFHDTARVHEGEACISPHTTQDTAEVFACGVGYVIPHVAVVRLPMEAEIEHIQALLEAGYAVALVERLFPRIRS